MSGGSDSFSGVNNPDTNFMTSIDKSWPSLGKGVFVTSIDFARASVEVGIIKVKF